VTRYRLLDILIPRFVTEDVACLEVICDHCDELHLLPVCSMESVEPGEVFDAIVPFSCFNLFGWVLFSRPVGEPMPFVNPHHTRGA
jgi:hypothetical protein